MVFQRLRQYWRERPRNSSRLARAGSMSSTAGTISASLVVQTSTGAAPLASTQELDATDTTNTTVDHNVTAPVAESPGPPLCKNGKTFLEERVHEITNTSVLPEKTCPMCYDTYTLCNSKEAAEGPADVAVRIEPCGHIMGLQCLRTHIAQVAHEYSSKCPVCRTDLFTTGRQRNGIDITNSLTLSLQRIQYQVLMVQQLAQRCDAASDTEFPALRLEYARSTMGAVDLYNDYLDFCIEVWNTAPQDLLARQSRELHPLSKEIETLTARTSGYEERLRRIENERSR